MKKETNALKMKNEERNNDKIKTILLLFYLLFKCF
uniref:Uncharacterized protein n=1 Tax=viral metagenome TaxID=1070528 RepID=A0A6C0I705_9ZZZZ